MKKLLILSVLSIYLIGCNREYCQKHYPCPQVDSINSETNLISSIVWSPIPQRKYTFDLPFYCKDGKITVVNNGSTSEIIYKDKILTINTITPRDSAAIISNFMSTNKFKQLIKTVEIPIEVIKWPKWLWYSLGLNIALLGWVTRKLWLKPITIGSLFTKIKGLIWKN